MKIKIRWSLD